MNNNLLAICIGSLLLGLVYPVTSVRAISMSLPTFIDGVSDPGILPDSPFYFLKGWGRAIRLFFAFDSAKKAELELRFSSEDTLAIQALCDKGKCDLAEKHAEKFQDRLQKAIQKAEQVQEQGRDIESLIEKLKQNNLRQQEVLAGVLEKAPEQAQEGLLNAIENSNRGLENAVERIQGQQEKQEFRRQRKLLNIEEKIEKFREKFQQEEQGGEGEGEQGQEE